jgi:hypothetical protein
VTASTRDLESTARMILAEGRGILAADESTGTMSKRLEGEGIESTKETRRRFRELMFTTDGIEQWIGGVILYDETIRQSTSDARRFRSIWWGVESSQASRSTPAPSHWLARLVRGSPMGSTGCASGLKSTARWMPVSPSGGR